MIDILLLAFMLITALYVATSRDLLAVVMVFGIYSLLSAGMFMVMDAADVSFTEAAVGAGVSTILMLIALSFTGRYEKPQPRQWLALGMVLLTGVVLVWGTFDLPPVGDPGNPIHQHVAPYYLTESARDIDIPNVVTSVLASYRGFDTLGETVVIFTAGIAILMLLKRAAPPGAGGKD